jgi:hypothetical protein
MGQMATLKVYHNGLVGWRCQKQDDNAAALSTTEAEYRACSETGQEVQWVEQLLAEVYPLLNMTPSPVRLYCDNQGALALLKDSIYQHRTSDIIGYAITLLTPRTLISNTLQQTTMSPIFSPNLSSQRRIDLRYLKSLWGT